MRPNNRSRGGCIVNTDQITETNSASAESGPTEKAETSVAKATAPKKKSTKKGQSKKTSGKKVKDNNTAHHSIYELHLDDSYYSKNAADLEKQLEELNDKFASLGIKLSADQNSVLRMDIHEEKFASCTARHAGRKKKKSNKMLEEILEYRKTHTATQTAEWLGLTRQTYYRKLKAHTDSGDAGSVEF